MAQNKKSVFNLFMEGIGIYLKHFPVFFKYMTFPVLGQFLGIILSFALSLGFAFTIGASMNDVRLSFALSMLLALPGLIIFAKAFWEYLIAYVSIGSMAENTLKSGRIYDIDAHKKVATMTKRVGDFITLWILFGLFTMIAILPPMWIIAAIAFVFISLIFQVFTFERNSSAAECFKKSAKLVSKDFLGTVGMLLLVGILTYFLLPKLAEILLGLIQVTALFSMLIDPLVTSALPINQWNSALEALGIAYMITSLDIAKMITASVISWLIVSYTLPIRTICFTLWYKQLSISEIKSKNKRKKAKSDNV